jgi:transcriptional regulator GlxA family with amidase domain
MSPRNFARAFAREIGTTPGAYVERLRIEAARRLIETGDGSSAGVAAACGFRSAETFHRSFVRLVGTTPAMYRKHFRAVAG